MKIYLIGFMGSGKSTFGQLLAKEMGLEFADLDLMLSEKTGKSIAELFEDGEDAFRKKEAEMLRSTASMDNIVIASGGGAPCFEENMEWMLENGKVIYLKLFEPELVRRLKPEQENRPLLKGLTEEELEEYVYNTLRKRALYYHQAHIVIDALHMTPQMLAEAMKNS